MSHIPPKLGSGTQTDQNFHNQSKSCTDLDHLKFIKQNYHVATLARIETRVFGCNESFFLSK